jgi:Holliday junction resolvase
MTRYEEGRRLEWQICAEFRRWGYMAQRTAGSHSPVDVVAVPLVGCGAVFVQAKLGKMTKAERAAFHSFCVRARADAIVATKERGRSAIIYSRVLPDGGTVLIDGNGAFGADAGGCPYPVGEGQEAE